MQYDPAAREVLIVFRAGRGVYRYFDVPMEEWEAFVGAPSKGIYLNEVFKARHRYVKVDARERMAEDGVLRWPRRGDSNGA